MDMSERRQPSTNHAEVDRRLLDPALKVHDIEAGRLLARWGRLHTAGPACRQLAFTMFLKRLTGAAD